MPCFTSTRREDMATEAFGRSSAMRAGLSTVNVSGVGASSLRRSVICTLLPERAPASMLSRRFVPCAWTACTPRKSVTSRNVTRSTNGACPLRNRITGFAKVEHDILAFSLGSFCQRQRSRPLDVSAETIRHDLDDRYLVVGNADDASVVLPHIVAGQHTVNEPVLALNEAIGAALQLQGSDHAHRVERKLLQELARPLDVRPDRARNIAARRCARYERGTH